MGRSWGTQVSITPSSWMWTPVCIFCSQRLMRIANNADLCICPGLCKTQPSIPDNCWSPNLYAHNWQADKIHPCASSPHTHLRISSTRPDHPPSNGIECRLIPLSVCKEVGIWCIGLSRWILGNKSQGICLSTGRIQCCIWCIWWWRVGIISNLMAGIVLLDSRSRVGSSNTLRSHSHFIYSRGNCSVCIYHQPVHSRICIFSIELLVGYSALSRICRVHNIEKRDYTPVGKNYSSASTG